MATTTIHRNITLGTLGLATLLLTGCGWPPQFDSSVRYDNLITRSEGEVAADVRAQLLERAEANGLEPTYVDEDRLVFRMRAPSYTVTFPDGTTEERFDPRVVVVDAWIERAGEKRYYRYRARVEGTRPGLFPAEARARFGLALLRVREIFEMPLDLGDG